MAAVFHPLERGDSGFPPGLLDLPDPPLRLWVSGRMPQQRGIAIVGSRTPPIEAVAFARELALRSREPVVSGLALGVDAAAHRGALDGSGVTLAYVPYGFGRTYPPQHRYLEREIADAGGAIASEYAPKTPAGGERFAKRDRLQAAHARAVILVATEIDGGAMQTIRFARALGRPVYAVEPGPAAQGGAQWEGNLRALAGGAIPLPLYDVREALRLIT